MSWINTGGQSWLDDRRRKRNTYQTVRNVSEVEVRPPTSNYRFFFFA